MARILISLSVLFLTLSAVFGVLNTNKTRELRGVAERSNLERSEAEQVRLAKEKEIAAREAKLANTGLAAKPTPPDNRIATAEAQLIKAQSERAELQARIQAQ